MRAENLDLSDATSPIAGDELPTLRLATAGDVDDGKSTLLGRLLHDVGAIPADQVAALGADPDFSRLFDGLEAEREQGITIDVAYRYLTTPRRRFVVADAPGHVQYTRNMVTAASGADLALVLVDAAKAHANGLSEQTIRHLTIAALVDVDVIVAINKLDLLDFSQAAFDTLKTVIVAAAARLGLRSLDVLPVAAKPGDNVVQRGAHLGWWSGPTLFDALSRAPTRIRDAGAPLRLPAQRVAVLIGDGAAPRRFILGEIESGSLRRGDRVRVAPSGETAHIEEISILGRMVDTAAAGAAVAVRLDRPLDVTRGDVLAGDGFKLTRRITADICWMADRPWLPGRRLLLKQATATTPAFIDIVEVDRFAAGGAASLDRNAIARVMIATRDPILADRYRDSRGLGGLALLDPATNETAAAVFLHDTVDLDAADLMVGDGI